MVQRDVDGLAEALFEAPVVRWYYFLKIELPAVTVPTARLAEQLRYTQKKGGYVGDIDGSSQTWYETDFRPDGISQSNNSILEVSSVSLSNLDGLWTDKLLGWGLRGRWATIWQAWFDDAGTTLQGAYMLFQGQIDEVELNDRANLSLTPFRTPFAVIVPGREYTTICQYIYKDAMTCQYVGAIPDCDRTRNGANGCAVHANLIHFGGFDLMPKPNTSIKWGIQGENQQIHGI